MFFIKTTDDFNKTLDTVYTNPSSTGSFGGINRLYSTAKKRLLGLNLRQVYSYLQSKPTYTEFKAQRVRFKRRQFRAFGKDHIYAVDLADVSTLNLPHENKGVNFLLVIVDIFSKFAFVLPIKNKRAETVSVAFRQFFTNIAQPRPALIVSDAGGEFTSNISVHIEGIQH